MQPDVVARFLVTAFFAVVFIQSAIDKLVDRDGNIAFFSDHFEQPVAEGRCRDARS